MPADQEGNCQVAEALLLGRASVLAAGREVPLPTRKALALVAYLALEGHTDRSKLSELLWTDLDRASARGNLRRELYRLRATPLWTLLEIGADQLGFRGGMSTDVAAFQAHLDADRLAEALALYRGPLLCDLDLQGAEAFELWLAERRGRPGEGHPEAPARPSHAPENRGDLQGGLAGPL
ncbi:MAG: AfsR/SARP family transcriptional regulator, partial [Deinococcus sp.]